ncbi:hypothetical protein CHU98_g7582 [Xylaria longipes]|nr:hypothetical protein CHU98_g7582 [Xylaria longipes]
MPVGAAANALTVGGSVIFWTHSTLCHGTGACVGIVSATLGGGVRRNSGLHGVCYRESQSVFSFAWRRQQFWNSHRGRIPGFRLERVFDLSGSFIAMRASQPILKPALLSSTTWCLLHVLKQSKNIAWVTIGAKSANPCGSTGKPKGISLSHASLRNNIEVISQRFGLKRGTEVVLQQTALSFDMSLFQMFTTRCNHGTAVIPPEGIRGHAHALAALMLKTGVTMTAATPTDEKATGVLANNFCSLGLNDLQLIDAYGPAETSFACGSTIVPYHVSTAQRSIAPFKPLSNYAVYILGENDGKPVPVKLRGIRINLEEVEQCIVTESYGLLAEAAVSMRTASGTYFLIAHVVVNNSEASDEEVTHAKELHRHLSLPQYMRPSIIVPVASPPVNSSQKLDRQALRTLAVPVSNNTNETNQNLTPLQQQAKQLWEKVIPATVLAQRPITVETDFFHVGGTSLMLIELQSLIKKQLSHTPSVQQLFQSSTLGTMAMIVEGAAEEATHTRRVRSCNPLSAMKDMTQLGSDFPVRVLGLQYWVDEAQAKGLNHMLAAYLRASVGENTRLAFPKPIKGSS